MEPELIVIGPDGREHSFATGDVVIGRGPDCDIVIDDPAVSRRHLVVRFVQHRWVATDESSNGTFYDGRPLEAFSVPESTRVELGAAAGPTITLGTRARSRGQPSSLAPPVTPEPPPVRPPVAAEVVVDESGTIALDDHALRLGIGDLTRVFTVGSSVVVGRSDECDLCSDSGLVSGRHCRFSHDGTSWWIEDLGSTRGTFVDGRRVTEPQRVEGVFAVSLGDDTAGEELRVVTAGTHEVPRDRQPLLLAGGALLLAFVALGGLLYALTRDDGSDEPEIVVEPTVVTVLVTDDANSREELAAAKASTAQLLVFSGDDFSTGSGTFITDDLVLTNRHVAQTPTLSDPDEIFLAVADDEDAPVEIRFAARVEAVHPYLDIALVRVVSSVELDAEGTPVEATRRPSPDPLPVGDSAILRIGETINSLGFPSITGSLTTNDAGELQLPVVTVAEGEILSVEIWPGCANPTAEDLLVAGGFSSCSTAGDLARGNLQTSDLSGSGGSGGPVIVGGEIVGVRYAVSSSPLDSVSTAGVALSIPVQYFDDWLRDTVPELR